MTETSQGAGALSPKQVRTIGPRKRFALPSMAQLWAFRDLAYYLVRRDVTVRYKQTAIGASWAVLQPLGLAIVFSIFLGRVARLPSGANVPYPLFALSGLTSWLLFTNGMTNAALSTVKSEQLITKAYFPRIILPLAAWAPAIIDYTIAMCVVVIAMIAYGHPPGVEFLLLPVPVLLCSLLAIGVGLIFSALTVRYRDVQLLVPFLITVFLFMTPVMYPFELVPKGAQPFYALNPIVGVLELFRYCLFGIFTGPVWMVAVSAVAAVVTLFAGLAYFQHAESGFADVI
jgi:lipopolysaccharide transport system permease protein